MRALTVRQPWAWAIIHGGKDVENRTRNIAGDYRGPVAIHVALGFAELDEHWKRQIAREVGRLSRAGLPGNERVASHVADPDEPRHHVHRRYGHRGAVIGVVDLYDVGRARQSRWAMGDHWHLCLSNPRPIEPIPARGRLGLWRLDAGLEAAITTALTTTSAPRGAEGADDAP
jgi:hypothetical protein